MLGEGIVKGLAETARNFLGSFVDKERLVTVQFPEERLPVAEAARNFPFLIYDGVDPERRASLRGMPDLRERVSRHDASPSKRAKTRSQTLSASSSFIPPFSTSMYRFA